MANERPKNDDEPTPQGAVEIDESDLDQAAGGVSSGGDMPTESVSLNFSKTQLDQAGQKVAPQDPSIGLLQDGGKKI